MNTHSGICISLLGRFCLYLGEQEIAATAFKSRKALNLLKLLAIRTPHELHRDQALDMLWADLDPAAAAAQLYKAIHYLRKAFATSTAEIAPEDILVYKDEVLQLTAPGQVHTDAGAFQHGRRNYFCRWCGGFTTAAAHEPDPRQCSTPGCKRPFGFGSHVPR